MATKSFFGSEIKPVTQVQEDVAHGESAMDNSPMVGCSGALIEVHQEANELASDISTWFAPRNYVNHPTQNAHLNAALGRIVKLICRLSAPIKPV